GQDHHGDVVSGHDILRAARAARERGADPERRGYPVGRSDRRVGIRRYRKIGRNGGRGGRGTRGPGGGGGGQRGTQGRILPAHGARDRGFRSDHQGQAGDGAQVRARGAAGHEGHHG